jgi:hypothetical protein
MIKHFSFITIESPYAVEFETPLPEIPVEAS